MKEVMIRLSLIKASKILHHGAAVGVEAALVATRVCTDNSTGVGVKWTVLSSLGARVGSLE